MTLIRSVHVLVQTGSEEGAGTDGDVYLGAAGREFHLDTEENDFERASQYTYRFGTFPTVIEPTLNDPQRQQLRLEDVNRLPLYIRFAPSGRGDRWKLQRAVVAFNSEETPLWDSAVNAPDGIWLGASAGVMLHVPRVVEGRPPLDPGRLAELTAQLFAEQPSRELPPQADEPPKSEVRLVESLTAFAGRVDAPGDDGGTAARKPVPAREAFERLKALKGASALFGLSANLEKPDAWGEVASLSVCERTGTASSLHVSGSIDIFDDRSMLVWGGGDWPPTARVSCGFTAPAEGLYVCAVVMRAFSPWGAAVECLIDGRSFGQTIIGGSERAYSFLARLGVGGHEFTVRDQGFAFRFYNLAVFQIPIATEN